MSLAFSVVICTYDEERWGRLCQAIRSVQAQTLAPSEVIVVVDGNESLLARARQELDGASVVENAEAPGLCGARNSGWRAARTSHIAFLDDDAEASRAWLEHLAEPFSEPDVAGVGGLTTPSWHGKRPPWLPPEFDWVIGAPHPGVALERQEVRNLWGGNMSFARDLIATLGGFRLGFPDDETELCLRLRQRWPQKRLVWVPEAVVAHHVDASNMTVRRFLARCYSEGESKAVVAQLCGPKDALASERRYTREVLPRGITSGLRDFLLRADAAGAARATLIVAGLASAAGGYLLARTMPTRAATKRGLSTPPSPRDGGDGSRRLSAERRA